MIYFCFPEYKELEKGKYYRNSRGTRLNILCNVSSVDIFSENLAITKGHFAWFQHSNSDFWSPTFIAENEDIRDWVEE